jgi:hypothetical protein
MRVSIVPTILLLFTLCLDLTIGIVSSNDMSNLLCRNNSSNNDDNFNSNLQLKSSLLYCTHFILVRTVLIFLTWILKYFIDSVSGF